MTAPTKFERVGCSQPANNGAPPSAPSRAAPAPSAFIAPILLDDKQSAATLGGMSVRKFHELRAEPWMPRPVVLGPRMLLGVEVVQ